MFYVSLTLHNLSITTLSPSLYLSLYEAVYRTSPLSIAKYGFIAIDITASLVVT